MTFGRIGNLPQSVFDEADAALKREIGLAEREELARLRDHFAGLAMQAYLTVDNTPIPNAIARDAYIIADAMLAEKRRRG